MDEAWRAYLYPLGFFATFLFSLRFLIQWLVSEKLKESVIPKIFWQISLLANITMCLHMFIQHQLPFCLIQGCNSVISWRNLNFMQTTTKPRSFKFTLVLVCLSITLILGSFYVQGFFKDGLRASYENLAFSRNYSLHVIWPLIGFAGALIFSLRFWIQWIELERCKKSLLNRQFWLYSLFGAVLALAYFMKINDWVNILGYGSGIIPYLRNLWLMRKPLSDGG